MPLPFAVFLAILGAVLLAGTLRQNRRVREAMARRLQVRRQHVAYPRAPSPP